MNLYLNTKMIAELPYQYKSLVGSLLLVNSIHLTIINQYHPFNGYVVIDNGDIKHEAVFSEDKLINNVFHLVDNTWEIFSDYKYLTLSMINTDECTFTHYKDHVLIKLINEQYHLNFQIGGYTKNIIISRAELNAYQTNQLTSLDELIDKCVLIQILLNSMHNPEYLELITQTSSDNKKILLSYAWEKQSKSIWCECYRKLAVDRILEPICIQHISYTPAMLKKELRKSQR